jgi:hypothetical protein
MTAASLVELQDRADRLVRRWTANRELWVLRGEDPAA